MHVRKRAALAIGGVALALAVSVLALGGALRWVQAVVAAIVALALTSQLGSRRPPARLSPLIVLLGVAITLTALQLIPLPAGLLDALQPAGSELRRDGAALAGTAPWQAISLDAAGTLRALAFLITLLGVADLGLRIASTERGRYLVLGGVAVTCGLAAAVTGFHTLIDAERLYGVYAPRGALPVLGPLLNGNHLGGLMAIGALLALGLVFYRRQAPQLRVLWVVIAAGCSATALASLSRGATLGLGVGVVTLLALAIAGRLRTGSDPLRRSRALVNEVPIAIVIALGLAVAVYTSAGKVADQLENTTLTELDHPLSKFAAWRSSLQLIEESPWVGIGRGAFEPVFTRVHPPSAYVTFSHLENEYLQAVVEWGVPGALLFALALGWCIATACKRWRDGALGSAALAACAAIMFQSSVDFGVELLGLAVPVTLVAATLLSAPLRDARSRVVPAVRAALAGCMLAAAVALVAPITRSVQEDHDQLAGASAAELAATIERHPLDYLAFGEAAAAALRTGEPRAGKLLNHALRLHPSHPGLHRLAARMLLANGRRSQAAVEYALALHGSAAPRALVIEILTRLPEVELAAAAIPSEAVNRDQILRVLAELGRHDVAVRWLERVVQRPQHDLTVIDTLYRLALEHRDLAAAEAAARRRLAEARTNASRIMLAQVLFRREQFDQVVSDLADVAKWKGRIDEQAEAWLLVCDAHLENRAWDAALECLHKLDASAAITPARRGDVTRRLAIVNERRTTEAKQRAMEQLERTLGSRPSSP
jgi:O-antigen ligase/tetratricopeptide (TPR) repeat protein